ncbi:hypothetical protein MES4922_300068 [Mesorhizobium ventifaucium]|uniref:Uncharacterized protein n=1 Tax=Mesorhizobium ventifaucium TaxID=666020 RepID=A0ABN8JXU9_9HYPH|nr:hypothetical protein MES4922_300068 [Mesorhizobium ventifaucium]
MRPGMRASFSNPPAIGKWRATFGHVPASNPEHMCSLCDLRQRPRFVLTPTQYCQVLFEAEAAVLFRAVRRKWRRYCDSSPVNHANADVPRLCHAFRNHVSKVMQIALSNPASPGELALALATKLPMSQSAGSSRPLGKPVWVEQPRRTYRP